MKIVLIITSHIFLFWLGVTFGAWARREQEKAWEWLRQERIKDEQNIHGN